MGKYSLREFKLTGKVKEVIIQQHKIGTFITSYEHLVFKFIGFPFEIKKIEIDNVAYDLGEIDYDTEKNG